MKTYVNSIAVDFNVAGRIWNHIDMREFDDLYYRFERHEGSGSLSGELEFGESLNEADEPHAWADVNMTDTGKHLLDVEGIAYLTIRVKTAQAGYTGTLHLYARRRAGLDGGGP